MAKECRKVWQVACFTTPARRTAALIAFCNGREAMWWRRVSWERGATDSLADGKTYCHRHSAAAFGYSEAEAVAVAGIDTIPASPPAADEMDTIVASQLRAFNQLVAQQLEVLATAEPMEELGESAAEPEASSG